MQESLRPVAGRLPIIIGDIHSSNIVLRVCAKKLDSGSVPESQDMRFGMYFSIFLTAHRVLICPNELPWPLAPVPPATCHHASGPSWMQLMGTQAEERFSCVARFPAPWRTWRDRRNTLLLLRDSGSDTALSRPPPPRDGDLPDR